ncbi:hypothetical protein ACO0SA_000046 [Hanseniaspora valbyensis]
MLSSHSSNNMNKNHPILSIKPSYNTLVRGCPGIPNTLPRVEFELQIMAPNTSEDSTFTLDHLEVSFKTTEQLFLSSAHGKEDATTGQKNVKVETFKKRLKLNDTDLPPLLGVKLPITIAIPENVKQTNVNEKFGRTYSSIEVVCHYRTSIDISNNNNNNPITKKIMIGNDLKKGINKKKSIDSKCAIEFPVVIEKYDTYPSSKKYPSLQFKEMSPDYRVNIEYRLNSTCFGKDDMISVDLKLAKNEKSSGGYYNGNGDLLDEVPVNQGPSIFIGGKKKLKLKEATIEIKEVLEVLETQDGMMRTKENVLCSSTNVINELITGNDITTRLDLRLMLMDDAYKKFEDAIMSPDILFKLPNEEEEDNEEGEEEEIKEDHQVNKYNNYKFKRATNPVKNTVPEVLLVNPSVKIGGNNHQDALNTYGSVSTRGCYFNITHYLTIKFKCSGVLKNFEITQPITISHWSAPQVKYVEQYILEEMDVAKNAKQFYDNFGGIKKIYSKNINNDSTSYYLDYPSLPPMIIPYDLNFLSRNFGIEHEYKKSELQMVPMII